MVNKAFYCVALLLLAAFPAPAAVADSSPTGFTLKIPLHIQAAPADVYQKFVQYIGDWWNPAHTFSGSAKNLSIEEKAMGCFCEKLAGGGAVRHLEVVYFTPGKLIVLSGALGPMQSLAAAGNMRVQFTPEEGGTKLDVTYAVTGYLPGGINAFAAPADGMLTEQFTRLKDYAEHGDPAKAEAKPMPVNAADVGGSWNGELSFTNGKQREVVAKFAMADNKVTGTLTGADGSHEILDGKFDGEKVTFYMPSGASDVPILDFVAYRDGDGLKVEVTGKVATTGQRMQIGGGVLKRSK